MSFDLLIRGGRLVHPEGIVAADLAVRGERIAAVLAPGESAEAAVVIDATDRLVLPGLVDAHVHLREPGLTWKEDFATGTRAAVAGGVTTVLVMPTDEPWTVTVADLSAKRALAEGRIFADVGLQVAVGRSPEGLADLVAAGATSFEIFTADVPDAFLHDTPARLAEAVAVVHAAGGRAAVSPGEDSILRAELARLTPGRSTPADFVRTRPDRAEAHGLARAILVAAEAGAPVHIRQINSRRGLDVLRRLRTLADVSVEVSPQSLFFTTSDYDRLGPLAKASPPFRTAEDRDAMRAALADGTIDIVVTDHAPHTSAEKRDAGEDFAAVPGGFAGLQTLLPALVALVDAGVIGWTDLVRVASTRPAALFGLEYRKGRLAPGYEADILVIDPQKPSVAGEADQWSRSPDTPFAGLAVSATLERVVLRGVAVAGPEGPVEPPRGRLFGAGR